MKLWLVLFGLFTAAPSIAAYNTTCKIENGRAYGWVHNQGDAFEIDGYVWFYFFDERGALIDSEDEYEYEYVSRKSSEEIDYTSAPGRAVSCSFDISQAIKGEPPPVIPSPGPGPQPIPPPDQEIRYTTSCQLVDGNGRGFVHNLGDAFEIDGYVMFYFFDERGGLIDSEDEYEYEYVSRKSTEEIDYTRAPSGAASCSFDIAPAIKR